MLACLLSYLHLLSFSRIHPFHFDYFVCLLSILASLLSSYYSFLGATTSSSGSCKCGIKKTSRIVGGSETEVKNCGEGQ